MQGFSAEAQKPEAAHTHTHTHTQIRASSTHGRSLHVGGRLRVRLRLYRDSIHPPHIRLHVRQNTRSRTKVMNTGVLFSGIVSMQSKSRGEGRGEGRVVGSVGTPTISPFKIPNPQNQCLLSFSLSFLLPSLLLFESFEHSLESFTIRRRCRRPGECAVDAP